MSEELPSWGHDYEDRPAPAPLPVELEAEVIRRGNHPRDFGVNLSRDIFQLPDEHCGRKLPAEFYYRNSALEPATPDGIPELADLFAEILDWIHDTGLNTTDKRYLKAVALRTLAMTWVIDPKRLGGDSLRALSLKIGVKASMLSRPTSEFSRKFKIRNRFKVHDYRATKNKSQPPNALHDEVPK